MKTTLRSRYESEAQVIKSKIGELEDIRNELNLSARKMSQLLLIDPSTWTRWTKGETQVPPHIFRSLQWYLALIEKQPEWHPMNSYFRAHNQNEKVKWQEETQEIKKEMKILKKRHFQSNIALTLVSLCLFFSLFYFLIRFS